jgi:hypothetical protein
VVVDTDNDHVLGSHADPLTVAATQRTVGSSSA